MKSLFLILLILSCKEEEKKIYKEIDADRCISRCVSAQLNGFEQVDGIVVEKFIDLCKLELKDRACCLDPDYRDYAIPCDSVRYYD